MPITDDPFNLERFVQAQRGSYATALAELQAGQKRSHWMWYIFPQIAGLGHSATAQRYAIGGADEARAYLAHPLLGARLAECCAALLSIEGRSASAILGYPDDLKLRSSMTLFSAVSPPGSIFAQVLAKYYQGEPDARTLKIVDNPMAG